MEPRERGRERGEREMQREEGEKEREREEKRHNGGGGARGIQTKEAHYQIFFL